MKIEIDQSGHVEYTATNTVVADSLGSSLLIKSSDKRIIQDVYRSAGKPRLFVPEIFALLLAVLIKTSFQPIHEYIVDLEYPGKTNLIKGLILKFSQRIAVPLKPEQIKFALIGKKSLAHLAAHKRFVGESRGKTIKSEKILRIILP